MGVASNSWGRFPTCLFVGKWGRFPTCLFLAIGFVFQRASFGRQAGWVESLRGPPRLPLVIINNNTNFVNVSLLNHDQISIFLPPQFSIFLQVGPACRAVTSRAGRWLKSLNGQFVAYRPREFGVRSAPPRGLGVTPGRRDLQSPIRVGTSRLILATTSPPRHSQWN